MKALFFGSIGVIAETSELQRRAYNAAFRDYGLDWYWSVANYCEMLKKPGGMNRVAFFSNGMLTTDEVNIIHAKKRPFSVIICSVGSRRETGLLIVFQNVKRTAFVLVSLQRQHIIISAVCQPRLETPLISQILN